MGFKNKYLLLKEDKSEDSITRKVLSKIRLIKGRAKSEITETRALVRILTHTVKSYIKTRELDLNEKDKEFIKSQSGDVVKSIILIIVAIIPLPIPITPFLVIFGKNVGIDFIPKSQDIPEKGMKKQKIEESKIKENSLMNFIKTDDETFNESIKPMKLIVSNNQYKQLLGTISEQTNPCPKGIKQSPLYTTKDLENGVKLSKGYCNTNANSALVIIQKGLQNKGLLRTTIIPGYFGNETETAVKKLFGSTSTKEIKIGKNTLNRVKSPVKDEENFLKEFNKLTFNEKVLVITLLGEAGGEGEKGMLAVASVLKNRTRTPEFKSKGDIVSQALSPYQFSLWNPYTIHKKPFKDISNHVLSNQKDSIPTAIKIVKNLSSINDITNGSTHYYKDTLTFPWSKDTGLTKWEFMTKIGQHIFGKYVKKKK